MKKTIIIVGLVLALGIGSAIAYADSTTQLPFGRNFGRMPWSNNSSLTDKQIEELVKEREEFHEENMEYRKDELKKAYDNGEITKDEYNSWSEHFTYMDEFHKENGFFGGCGGRGMGMGMGRMGRGMGMMRGFGNRQGGFY